MGIATRVGHGCVDADKVERRVDGHKHARSWVRTNELKLPTFSVCGLIWTCIALQVLPHLSVFYFWFKPRRVDRTLAPNKGDGKVWSLQLSLLCVPYRGDVLL